MARSSKTDHLAQVQLFSACSRRELSHIARACDEVTVDAGTLIVEEGSVGHEFYLIVEGEATVERGGGAVATVGPGQYFGELALLDGAPRNASVRATTPMTLIVLGQREFSALLDSWPTVAHKLLVQMAKRLRHADTEAVSH